MVGQGGRSGGWKGSFLWDSHVETLGDQMGVCTPQEDRAVDSPRSLFKGYLETSPRVTRGTAFPPQSPHFLLHHLLMRRFHKEIAK